MSGCALASDGSAALLRRWCAPRSARRGCRVQPKARTPSVIALLLGALLLTACGELGGHFDVGSWRLQDLGGPTPRPDVIAEPDLRSRPELPPPPDVVSSLRPACPEPEGPWRAYFSKPVADEGACGDVALDRALAYWIGQAERSVDLAVYSLDAKVVGDALIAAHAAGRAVRLIVNKDDDRVDAVEAAGVAVRRDPDERLMHHKFAVLDSERVWFSSANATTRSGRGDANNALVVDAAPFAEALTTEFARLWAGGFHQGKGPGVHFSMDGGAATLFFSPYGGVDEALLALIAEADHEILVAMLAFTRQDLADALLARCGEIDIHVLVDAEPFVVPEPPWTPVELGGCPALTYLPDAVPLTNGLDWEPVLHHKYMLVDAGHPDSAPTLVTGSMNWSWYGLTANDEAVLVWQHAAAAAEYRAEFRTRLEEAGGRLQGD